jgi:ABC-type transport system involved in cytochrome c biogenesis permease subunit
MADEKMAATIPGANLMQRQAFVFKQLQQSTLADLERLAGDVVQSIDQRLDGLCQAHAVQLEHDLTRLLGGSELPDAAALYGYDRLRELPELYAAKDATGFNEHVAAYLNQIAQKPPQGIKTWRLGWESFYNRLAPYYRATFFYFLGFLVSVLAWIGARQFLNRLASAVLLGGALIHLLGVVVAVGISGRPPVTGLYSSFIVVTFGVVQLFLVIEFFARFGLGNLLSSLMGIAGLLWAWNITLSTPDTFSVMVAVLDTNFWLSTHVICVSMGYMATLVAGLLGLAYIVGGVLTPLFSQSTRATITRLIYGVTCFALLFSFVGTVLGGLWADDSWGRFWGWDPKENGALMIVLWNAVLLHARWSGMARQRGLAALAVLGNVVVTWSWEGVNQLGVGLHAYALSDVNKFQWLMVFWISQIAIAALVLLPTDRWYRRVETEPA